LSGIDIMNDIMNVVNFQIIGIVISNIKSISANIIGSIIDYFLFPPRRCHIFKTPCRRV